MGNKDTFFSKKRTINCRGTLFDFNQPRVMGILNITPDSFYDGGKYDNPEQILEMAKKMISDGADILDIGAYSSRPGAEHISEKDELNRLISVVEIIRKNMPEVIISIDTFRSEIARIMIEDYESDIVNDISGGDMDNKMFETVARLNIPYILMHMQGSPQNMQLAPTYDDIVRDILFSFSKKIDKLTLMGVNDIIIDPGFGFGKTIDHNYELISRLDEFKIIELPLLVGLSRKSMIYKTLNTSPKNALTGTIALNMVTLQKGADILRVHDVKEAKETIDIFLKLNTKAPLI